MAGGACHGADKEKGMKTKCALAAAGLLAVAGAASADHPFTCGERIIDDGEQKALVLEYCGEPTDREGNQWIYDQGAQRFLIVVHFDGDVVTLIEQVPRD
jgi:hypothetical protein